MLFRSLMRQPGRAGGRGAAAMYGGHQQGAIGPHLRSARYVPTRLTDCARTARYEMRKSFARNPKQDAQENGTADGPNDAQPRQFPQWRRPGRWISRKCLELDTLSHIGCGGLALTFPIPNEPGPRGDSMWVRDSPTSRGAPGAPRYLFRRESDVLEIARQRPMRRNFDIGR